MAVGLLPDALAFPLARLERYGMLILLLFLFVIPYVGEQTGHDLQHPRLADRRAGRGVDPARAGDHRAERMNAIAMSLASADAGARDRRNCGSWSSISTAMKGRSICCSRLAREQKVDLGKISILALADQYLAFIARQRSLRLEIAADYLVMAAWLAYLKSRLLLPQPPADDEPSGAELAAELEHRLQAARGDAERRSAA